MLVVVVLVVVVVEVVVVVDVVVVCSSVIVNRAFAAGDPEMPVVPICVVCSTTSPALAAVVEMVAVIEAVEPSDAPPHPQLNSVGVLLKHDRKTRHRSTAMVTPGGPGERDDDGSGQRHSHRRPP